MMDMIDYQPGGRSGSTGGGVDPNTGKGSSSGNSGSGETTETGHNSSTNEKKSNSKRSPIDFVNSAIFVNNRSYELFGFKYSQVDKALFEFDFYKTCLEAIYDITFPGFFTSCMGAAGLYLDVNQMIYEGESKEDAVIKGHIHLAISKLSDLAVKDFFSKSDLNKKVSPILEVRNYIVSSAISLCCSNWFDCYYDFKKKK